jgi:hypothetical protein
MLRQAFISHTHTKDVKDEATDFATSQKTTTEKQKPHFHRHVMAYNAFFFSDCGVKHGTGASTRHGCSNTAHLMPCNEHE